MTPRGGKPGRIVVGLSGGVDSAVSAWLLKRAGHEVVGLFMKNWEDDDRPAGEGGDDDGSGATDAGYCTTRQDFLDAASVADVLGIEIEHVNFAADYKDRVFAEFLREYAAGRTPNPDVLCNAEIKFKAFLDHAVALGAEGIATGHYARVRKAPGGVFQLLKGLDPLKDQSYFLHRLNQRQLATTLFPVGELPKTEVRRIAAEIGLPNAAKKDSTGICFIGERPFREFLSRYLAHRPGPIEDERGRIVGRHVGLSFYTLGQRKGLGIGGVKPPGPPRRGAAGRAGAAEMATAAAAVASTAADAGEHEPWFVAGKDLARNVLRVVQGHDHPRLQSQMLEADDASWIAGRPPWADDESSTATSARLAAKTRYRQEDAACALAAGGFGDGDGATAALTGGAGPDRLADGAAGSSSRFTLRFAEPQWAVTPGQSAVVYDGEVCLGGGVIAASR